MTDHADRTPLAHDVRGALGNVITYAELVRTNLETLAERYGVDSDDPTLTEMRSDLATVLECADQTLAMVDRFSTP